MALTHKLGYSAADHIPPKPVHKDTREHLGEWRKACSDLFDAEVAREAARLVEERLAGPYTHKYKGVAVTKGQFWALMKAEGFELTRAS